MLLFALLFLSTRCYCCLCLICMWMHALVQLNVDENWRWLLPIEMFDDKWVCVYSSSQHLKLMTGWWWWCCYCFCSWCHSIAFYKKNDPLHVKCSLQIQTLHIILNQSQFIELTNEWRLLISLTSLVIIIHNSLTHTQWMWLNWTSSSEIANGKRCIDLTRLIQLQLDFWSIAFCLELVW